MESRKNFRKREDASIVQQKLDYRCMPELLTNTNYQSDQPPYF